MRKGKTLEKLVEVIERTVSINDRDVFIQSPMKIKDRITGKLREHDLGIMITKGHHTTIIVFECRDRSRPVGSPEIEQFKKKCEDTQVSQGIIVSSKGFCKTARKKAEHYGIKCLNIKEVAALEWLDTTHIEVIRREILSTHWTIFPYEDLRNIVTECEIVDEKGLLISAKALDDNIIKAMAAFPQSNCSDIVQNIRISFKGKGILLKDKKTGRAYPVENAIADVNYRVRLESIPLKKFKYLEESTGIQIASSASARIKIDNIDKEAFFIKQPGKGTHVILTTTGK